MTKETPKSVDRRRMDLKSGKLLVLLILVLGSACITLLHLLNQASGEIKELRRRLESFNEEKDDEWFVDTTLVVAVAIFNIVGILAFSIYGLYTVKKTDTNVTQTSNKCNVQ